MTIPEHQWKDKEPQDDDEATKKLAEMYDGIYYKNLAVTQFLLSRQEGKSISDSLQDVHDKIMEVTTEKIEGR